LVFIKTAILRGSCLKKPQTSYFVFKNTDHVLKYKIDCYRRKTKHRKVPKLVMFMPLSFTAVFQ